MPNTHLQIMMNPPTQKINAGKRSKQAETQIIAHSIALDRSELKPLYKILEALKKIDSQHLAGSHHPVAIIFQVNIEKVITPEPLQQSQPVVSNPQDVDWQF